MSGTRRENENVMLVKLSGEDLIGEIKDLFQTERKITRDILDRINEVERRRLYAERGFSSLFKRLTKEIGNSHPAANGAFKPRVFCAKFQKPRQSWNPVKLI